MFVDNTTVIVPTKNRANSLNNLLNYFDRNNIRFKQFLIIDSSKNKEKYKHNLIKKFKINIIKTSPSTARQRNIGLNLVEKDSTYVMFLDDDIIFYKHSFQNMDKTINKYKKNGKVAGFAFNLISNQTENFFSKKFKSNFFLKFFNLYPNSPGHVSRSGWHSTINNVRTDTFVQWLFSGATIYKKKIIKNDKFDENLGIYSYLEDLFFSYEIINRGYKLLVPKNAKFLNVNFVERSNFGFGVKEIINRYKFVKKYKLSISKFLIVSFLRFLKSFFSILKLDLKYFMRSLGNIYAFIKIIFRKI